MWEGGESKKLQSRGKHIHTHTHTHTHSLTFFVLLSERLSLLAERSLSTDRVACQREGDVNIMLVHTVWKGKEKHAKQQRQETRTLTWDMPPGGLGDFRNIPLNIPPFSWQQKPYAVVSLYLHALFLNSTCHTFPNLCERSPGLLQSSYDLSC